MILHLDPAMSGGMKIHCSLWEELCEGGCGWAMTGISIIEADKLEAFFCLDTASASDMSLAHGL